MVEAAVVDFYGSLISCCSGSFLLASQGQIQTNGLALALRHWLLHYVQVKPLTLCHWGISMATHRDGYQNSEQIKTYCLHPPLHQRQVQLQIQLGTVHCHSSCRNRFSILFGLLVWRDTSLWKQGDCKCKPIQPTNWMRQEIKTWIH